MGNPISYYPAVVTPASTDEFICQSDDLLKKITTEDSFSSNPEIMAGSDDIGKVSPAGLTSKIDTDPTMMKDSDYRIPSQKAYRAYVGNTIINKGKAWISHGNNVITFASAHSDNNYRWVGSLNIGSMGGVTSRNGNLSIFLSNETVSRGKVRIEGGYGFTSGGYIAAADGTTERFDDVANTHTGRTAATARYASSGYSLNGFGFASCGEDAGVTITGITERFDDVVNTHTARTAATVRIALGGYSLDGYGFTSTGYDGVMLGTTERFDDVANTHTARTAATARRYVASYSLNGYGFTSCGFIAAITGITERFDDTANTHTARTAATAREGSAGYSLNGYGVTSCGVISVATGTTERFDDVANTHTARTAATSRYGLIGYSLSGFGFTSCGGDGAAFGTTERFDDVANTHTARTAATARKNPAGYATNEYFINYLTTGA